MTDQIQTLADLLSEWDEVQHQSQADRDDWLRRLIALQADLHARGVIDPGPLDPNFRP